MSLRLPERPILLWMVRVLSAAAIGLCGYLLYLRLSGRIDSIAGCGDRGCSGLLGGRWSQWLGIPVTALAAAVYGGTLVLTLPAVQRSPGRTADQLMAAAGMVLAMAAVWFAGVMAFADHGAANDARWCAWCLTLHGIGLAVAVILLADARRTSASGGGRLLEAGGLTGATGIAVLILGQLFGTPPATHQVTRSSIPGAPASATPASHPSAPAPGGRTITYFQSSADPLTFEVGRDPHLGPADARHVMVEYFDYTCRSCRDMYGDLQALKKKWPGVFTVVALPVPLHRNCNPWLSPSINNHAGACELAQMALAMWKAAPQHFPEYHDFLMRLPLPPSLPEARAKGEGLAGVVAFSAAMNDEAIKMKISEHLLTFRRLTQATNRMPKLLLQGDTMMHGTARNTDEFMAEIAKQFRPEESVSAGTPVSTVPR